MFRDNYDRTEKEIKAQKLKEEKEAKLRELEEKKSCSSEKERRDRRKKTQTRRKEEHCRWRSNPSRKCHSFSTYSSTKTG